MKKEKVTIIVLNYNGQKFLEGCFSSLAKQSYSSFEMIMVDDNSTDESVTFVRRCFPKVKVIRNKENLGACISFNKAVKMAKTDLIVKIDNDIIAEKNWLKEMVETLNKDAKVGLVGSKILQYKSDEIQDIGSSLDRFGYPINYLFLKKKAAWKKQKILEVFYISGCSMLFRKSLFNQIGGFDEKFFLYKDDLDFCWRIKLLGYKTVVNLDSRIYHLSGVVQGGTSILSKEGKYHTTSRKRYFGERNTLRTLLKNYSNFSLLKILPLYFLLLLAESGFFAILGKFKVAKAYFDALIWNWRNLPDTWREHRRIQSLRVVSDKEILREMIKGSSRLKFFLETLQVPQFD